MNHRVTEAQRGFSLLILIAVILLIGCGGGGGTKPQIQPPKQQLPPPVEEPFVLEPLIGQWNLSLEDGDAAIEWPEQIENLTVSRNGAGINISLPNTLLDIAGDPGGWVATPGGQGKKAHSINRFYGGVIPISVPPFRLAVHHQLYEISVDSIKTLKLEVSIHNGETSDNGLISHRWRAVYTSTVTP